MEQLQQYILITGATSGIGRHIAVNLSKRFALILNGRNLETLSDTYDLCSKEKNHLRWIFDLSNVQDVEVEIQSFIAHNKISIVGFVHCAGFLKMVPLKSISFSDLKLTMNINFAVVVLLIKSMISKKVNAAGLKNVVFISSTASIRGAKAFNVYSASKGALDALMRSLAVELAPKVRLNSVLPGGIHTKMTENIFEDKILVDRMAKDYPLGLGEPADIYEMVEFLISEKSKWITGQQFVVDGGRTINISA
ncbi:MAG: SDR family oxidoreductase [Ferruginibacter sp.]